MNGSCSGGTSIRMVLFSRLMIGHRRSRHGGTCSSHANARNRPTLFAVRSSRTLGNL